MTNEEFRREITERLNGMRKAAENQIKAIDQLAARLAGVWPDIDYALRELLESHQTPIPPYEAGRAAQDAWADRKAKARINASALLTSQSQSKAEHE